MPKPVDIGNQKLLRAFLERGFTGLLNDEPKKLSAYLEERAVETGHPAFIFVAEALAETYLFFLEHDEAGGVRVGFVHQLDRLVFEKLRALEGPDQQEAAYRAREFRDELRRRIILYDPGNTY